MVMKASSSATQSGLARPFDIYDARAMGRALADDLARDTYNLDRIAS